ncbi:MAG TPA: hypothetical protein VFA12_18095 [Stellaceae bacterium]|nr:hypothetical protein [Stellaceae bacterium]
MSEAKTNRKNEPTMNISSIPTVPVEPKAQMLAADARLVDDELRAFLAGDNDGEDLLHALYDHILAEPVPQRMRALLNKG